MTGTEGAAAEVTAETHTVEAAAVVAGPTEVPICTVEDLLPGTFIVFFYRGIIYPCNYIYRIYNLSF